MAVDTVQYKCASESLLESILLLLSRVTFIYLKKYNRCLQTKIILIKNSIF